MPINIKRLKKCDYFKELPEESQEVLHEFIIDSQKNATQWQYPNYFFAPPHDEAETMQLWIAIMKSISQEHTEIRKLRGKVISPFVGPVLVEFYSRYAETKKKGNPLRIWSVESLLRRMKKKWLVITPLTNSVYLFKDFDIKRLKRATDVYNIISSMSNTLMKVGHGKGNARITEHAIELIEENL